MDLEIKVMSCKGLAVFNFFQKLSMYASVSIMSDDQRVELTPDQKQEQKTSVDEEGDGNPEWNHTVFFNLRRLEPIGTVFNHLSIVFEFRHQGQLFGDKIVGEVRVPVTGLIDSVGIDVVRFVSYEVRGSDGKHNGILDFSYKVSRNYDDAAAVVVHSDSGNSDHFQQHHNHNHHIHPNQGEIIRHFHQKHDNDLEQQYFNDPERIRYPRIGFEDFGSASSALVSSGNQYYPPAPNINSHYPTHHPDVYLPRAEHQWHLVPQQGPHYQPPPPPPVVYPTPQYGDPHWGYYRPPGSNQPNGGCDGYHRW